MALRLTHVRRELPLLLKLALPLIAGELGWVAMGLVDTVMLGHQRNAAMAMSASALAQVLFNTLCFGVGGVLFALDGIIAQSLGAREQEEANAWFWNGLLIAFLLAGVLSVLFAFGPRLMILLPADRTMIATAVPAMYGLNWGVLPLLVYFALRRYLQAAHHGRPIAIALISANLINFAGDWLLIYGHHFTVGGRAWTVPAYGVVGSAWATSFARLYLAVFLAIAVLWIDHRHGYQLGRQRLRIEAARLRTILRIGVPVGLSIFVEIAIFALVTALIGTFGPAALAGHNVALECASTTFMVPLAISSATSVRVGHAIGRMRIGEATIADVAAAGYSGIGASALFMLAAAVAFFAVPHFIAGLFTQDNAVINAAVPLLLIAAGFQFFDGVQVSATGALRGAGNTITGLATQTGAYWALGMPLGLWLAYRHHLGAAGLWWGLLIALLAAAVVLLLAWSSVLKKVSRE